MKSDLTTVNIETTMVKELDDYIVRQRNKMVTDNAAPYSLKEIRAKYNRRAIITKCIEELLRSE